MRRRGPTPHKSLDCRSPFSKPSSRLQIIIILLETCNDTIHHPRSSQSYGSISRLSSVASVTVPYVDSPCPFIYKAWLEPINPSLHHLFSIMSTTRKIRHRYARQSEIDSEIESEGPIRGIQTAAAAAG